MSVNIATTASPNYPDGTDYEEYIYDSQSGITQLGMMMSTPRAFPRCAQGKSACVQAR